MSLRAPKALLPIAACGLLSCLDPLVRPGEYTDVRARLAGDPGLERFDSLRLEIRDAGDTSRILSEWQGSRDSLSGIPLQFHAKGSALLMRVRGHVRSVGYCYSAWFRDDSLLRAEDSCAIPLLFQAFSPGDTSISINDSVVFRAKVTSRTGILAGYRWDLDGDGAADSGGTLAGGSAELAATRRYGAAPGQVFARLTVFDSDSNSITRQVKVSVELDPPMASAGPDPTVVLGDSLVLKGTASDGKGRVVSTAWYRAGDSAALAQGERLVVVGKALGIEHYVYRAVDDDGQAGSDTVAVTTARADSNATLRALFMWPGILTPAFSPGITDYRIEVPAGTDSLKVTARPAVQEADVAFPDFPEASTTGDLFRTLPFSGTEMPLRIKVGSRAGTGSEYRVTVVRGSGGDGMPLGYARVSDPAAAGPDLAGASAYNSAGQPVRFSRSGPGRFRVEFPGLGSGHAGEGHVQAVAYGSAPGYCAVESWGGPDFPVRLACFDARGAEADLPFGIAVAWPRAHSTGGNAFISDDTKRAPGGQKTQTASAYNSYNGAATGAITAAGTGTGLTETTFHSLNAYWDNLGNSLVTLRGRGPGWCRVGEIQSIGVDVRVATTCFSAQGAPADHLFSLNALVPGLGIKDFGLAYAILPGPGGFADPMPDPFQRYNSADGEITSTRLAKGRYHVRFMGLESAGGERTGIAMASAYGNTGTGYCQVESWTPSDGSAIVRCSDALGLPEDSRFTIQVFR